MIKFVSSKQPNLARISELLEHCRQANHWANCGPLYHHLASAYARHFGLGTDRAITPCANAGIALEAMARRLEQTQGRPLRWVGSAFSFQNLGRGYFADMHFVDCTESGLLDLAKVRALDLNGFDGLVVVNPFGLHRDLSAYIAFARETGKLLLIDNAAGVDTEIPDWPWQSFSLHHTKPYGLGEGGLALTPADEAAPLYSLLNYGPAPEQPAHWLNNGKISDVSCAFLIDRLEQADIWRPEFFAQAERVAGIAAEMGLRALRPFGAAAPAMSWAFVAPKPINLERVAASKTLVLGKYYKPLAPLPKTLWLYDHLVNIPTHPDVAKLSDSDLRGVIATLF
jgi:dTDP-4-amino-4,6-dideoxygalactose transaminase